MNKRILMILLCALCVVSTTQARSFFNKSKDVLIAQFDSKPDPDDIQAIAALGSMLAHADFNGVDYYAVAGAIGNQNGAYIPAPALFNMAFGAKNTNWTDGLNERNNSITRIKNKAKPILQNGGKVWVQEAGQSDITRDWIQALLNDGVAANTVKNNVIVVQHSKWNEDQTTAADLAWVKSNATYQAIDDGNGNAGTGTNRGPDTPSFRTINTTFLPSAKNSPNAAARALWVEADRVIQAHGHFPSHSSISTGGVDFSDCVENIWIFNVTDAGSVGAFWNKYVVNTTTTTPPNNGSLIGKTIALKAMANNKYVAADRNLDAVNWRLAANRSSVGAWEKFVVVDAGGGLIGLRANGNNQIVASDRGLDVVNWPLAANRPAVGGAWEKFTLVNNSDGTISLKASGNGKYVSADRQINNAVPPLAASRTAIGLWEKFTVEIQ